MTKSKIIIATVVGTIVLFLFDGAIQAIPDFGISAVESLQTNSLTTEQFPELSNRMAYIITDKTVSFVATKPLAYYSLPKFFAIELLSAFIISLLFAVLFSKFSTSKLSDRLLLTFVFGFIATMAIHIPYLNWWGFSILYTIGMTVRTVLGWLLIVFIQNYFIYKIR